jgi:glycosyltransferase involved in cell wall biosynthesis
MLAFGLARRGHMVTVFANPGSNTAGQLVPWTGHSSRSHSDSVRNSITLAWEFFHSRFDIVHSFSRLAYLTLILPLPVPKIMSYQRAICPRTVQLALSLSRDTLSFTAASDWMMQHVRQIGSWTCIPNGVHLSKYVFAPHVSNGAPLVFLGRVEEIKGPHLAIEIAKRSGAALVIAGNIPPEKKGWFDAAIAPHIDGSQIQYIGPVDDTKKNDLLRNARALLMPVLWDEPFGIVMVEAMACGTPVLGLSRGAIPEVIEHLVTGFVADDVETLTRCVQILPTIDRAACRARVERLYSDEVVVSAYEEVYRVAKDCPR